MTKLTSIQKSAIVRSIMNDVPETRGEDEFKVMQEKAIELMSMEIRGIYAKNPNALAKMHLGYLITPPIIVAGDADEKELMSFYNSNMVKKANERSSLARKIQGAVDGCNTLKQLREHLPEFEKYYKFLETAPVSKNLPAIAGVVAELTKFGWPKDAASPSVVAGS